MAKVARLNPIGLAVLVVVFCATLTAQSNSPEALQQKLNAQFKLTTTTADRSDIVTAGDVVALHKLGLVMFSSDAALPPTNVYKNGRIGQGFGTQMMMADKNQLQRRFVPEEKCWVTRVEVQNDGVVFTLFSDPYDNTRYSGALKIPFPEKKMVPPIDSFLQTIAEVLTVVPQESQASQPGPPAPIQTPVAAPAPAPMPVIAPPPPPPDAAPPTIAIGQTVVQVTTAFGQPLREANLGPKKIFYYKDMKVTFTNGKVSDVQ